MGANPVWGGKRNYPPLLIAVPLERTRVNVAKIRGIWVRLPRSRGSARLVACRSAWAFGLM
jgi:hypothetical protein